MASGEEDEPEVLVVDNGSWLCKAGLAGDDTARAYVPTVLGTCGESGSPVTCVGDGAKFGSACKSVWSPMERGIVVDWDAMETFWEHVFTRELRRPTQGATMLITEVPLNPSGNRDTMVQILMERFRVERLAICEPGHLSAVSKGRLPGLVLDIGHGVTHVSALVEGYFIPEASIRMDIGGYDVTVQLANELQNAGYSFSTNRELFYVEGLKHRLCDPGLDRRKPCSIPGTDVGVIITDNMAGCGEVLFQPSILGKSCPGIAEALYNSIMACDIDLRRDLCYNIYLSGGGSMYPNYTEMKARIQKYLESRLSDNVKISVMISPERQNSSWIGGSILASLSHFPDMLKSRHDYMEYGPSIFR